MHMGILILTTPTCSDEEKRGKEKRKKDVETNFYLLADCPFVERSKLGMDKICGEKEPGTFKWT